MQSVGFGALATIGFTVLGVDALTTGIAYGNDENATAAANDIQSLFRFTVNPHQLSNNDGIPGVAFLKGSFLGYGPIVHNPRLVFVALVVLATSCSTTQGTEMPISTTVASPEAPPVDLSALFGNPVGFSLENYDLEGATGIDEADSAQQLNDQQIHDEIQRIIMNGGVVGGPNGQLTPSGSIPPQFAPLPTQPGPDPNPSMNTSPVPPQNTFQQQISPDSNGTIIPSVDCSLRVVQGVGFAGISYTYVLSAIGPKLLTLYIKVKWSNKVEYSTLTFDQEGSAGAVLSATNPRPPVVVAYSDPALSTSSLSCSSA